MQPAIKSLISEADDDTSNTVVLTTALQPQIHFRMDEILAHS